MRLFNFLSFLIISCGFSLWAQDIWTEDWNAALQQAQREGKDLLINFTGSDWCVWCQRLDAEVFSTPSFRQQAPQRFILVKLDFPRGLPQTPAIRNRNQELAQRYGVEGYPTIFLADSKGRPYAKMGYQAGGPATFLRNMENNRQAKERDWSLLARAESSSGLDKAKLLDQFFTRAEENGNAQFFMELVDQIINLDAQNQAGLREKYQIKKTLEALKQGLNENSNWNQVFGQLNGLEQRAKQANQVLLQQDILVVQAAIYLNALNNQAEAKKILERVRSLNPTSTWGRLASDVLGRMR